MDHHHHHMSYYNRVSSGRGGSSSSYSSSSSSSSSASSTSSCHGKCRVFRLNLRRVYYLRLRKRFNFFLRIFDKLTKLSYSEALKILKKVFQRRSGGFKRNNSNSSRDSLVVMKGHVAPSYVRNNSFYAEAIADCLEFIKRTSVSSMDDQIHDPIHHHHHQDKIS